MPAEQAAVGAAPQPPLAPHHHGITGEQVAMGLADQLALHHRQAVRLMPERCSGQHDPVLLAGQQGGENIAGGLIGRHQLQLAISDGIGVGVLKLGPEAGGHRQDQRPAAAQLIAQRFKTAGEVVEVAVVQKNAKAEVVAPQAPMG